MQKITSTKPLLFTLLFAVCLAQAHEPAMMQTYQVTLENLSDGQALTPPLVVTHTEDSRLFHVGEAASAAVQAIAENGDLAPLMASLDGNMSVGDSVVSEAGPLVPSSNPGGTEFASAVTLTLHADQQTRYLSFISMLICSNDGFTGLSSVPLPRQGSRVLFVSGYDAGTEINTEDFSDLVPPCQGLLGIPSDDEGTGTSDPALTEDGVIHYHPGIQGGNDLLPEVHGWRNPVARITITRIDDLANRFVAPLSGAGEVPTVATYATGLAELRIDWEHRNVHFSLHTNGLSGITQAHIHTGLASENGPPVAVLYGPSDPTGLVDGPLSHGMIGEADLMNVHAGDFDAFVAALRQGQLYVNVHTADFGAGAIRGQIGIAASPARPLRR